MPPVVDTENTRASGFAGRLTAVAMVDDLTRPGEQRTRLGADWADDTQEFVSELRDRCVAPYVGRSTSGPHTTIDGRTARHAGNQRIRKRIEEAFGWTLSAAGQGKPRFRGLARVRFAFADGRGLQPRPSDPTAGEGVMTVPAMLAGGWRIIETAS